ncbi:MFS transporter prlL [Lachnellula suecica]|uniref:MFS transporter prlL n=1 Tax=Lachnellula suecica TaxID=602035 RepID=A0A8T9C041_9HELO|nr:MFS transporter prlL [Lachnellula suecica]
MADIKDDMDHVEISSQKGKDDVMTTADIELREALKNYVPGTEAEKKLVRKIDLYIMPMLWIMYIMNYVDRTNIGNAKVAGMDVDLDLDSNRYAWVLSVFFFGYLICEVPSNMILTRTRPSIFLPGIMLLWGALSAAMACVQNYADILVFRFILGCIESGFFPGVLFVMSCWYTKVEIGKRFAIFYSAAVLSGAFGGLLAGGITGGLDGAHGIEGWRWLFIIEGVATVGLSIIAKFVILDFPDSSKVLTLEERQLASVRILADSAVEGSIGSKRLTHWEAFKAAACDLRTYAFMLVFVLDVGAGTISYFIPTITKTLGYSTTKAQYMTVPVYAVATVCLNITAYSADHFNERRWHITGALAVGFICSLVCAIVQTAIVRYVMLCFVAAGIWTALPLIIAWASKTMDFPAEKRAICIAMINAVGNLSSVYGSHLWPSTSAPQYTLGWGVTAAFLGAGCLGAALIPVFMHYVPVRLTKAELALKEQCEIAADERRDD